MNTDGAVAGLSDQSVVFRVPVQAPQRGDQALLGAAAAPAVPPGTTLALTSFISCRISDGVGSSRRRSPHRSATRFQYEPYARRVPALTTAETTGTYAAKVGNSGRCWAAA